MIHKVFVDNYCEKLMISVFTYMSIINNNI